GRSARASAVSARTLGMLPRPPRAGPRRAARAGALRRPRGRAGGGRGRRLAGGVSLPGFGPARVPAPAALRRQPVSRGGLPYPRRADGLRTAARGLVRGRARGLAR